jgi:hypothetical protein
MNDPHHEVQVRLTIAVEDAALLLSQLSDGPDARCDLDRAIVLALTTAVNSHVVREKLSTYGLAVRRGEVRVFADPATTLMPGSGLDHTVAEAADPLLV